MLNQFLYLLVLCSFSISQPIFDLFSRNSDYFISWGMTTIELTIFLIWFYLCIPTILLIIHWNAKKINMQLGKYVNVAMTFILTLLITTRLLSYFFDLEIMPFLIVTLLCSVLLAYFIYSFPLFINNLNVFSIFTVISPIVFITSVFPDLNASNQEAIDLEFHQPVNDIPVVLIIYDELPLYTILDRNANIDSTRYQNFYEFSQNATFYKQARTVATGTKLAVPSILSGMIKPKGTLPSLDNYPINLFTVLANSHKVIPRYSVHTNLCPEKIYKTDRVTSLTKLIGISLDQVLVYFHLILPKKAKNKLRPISATDHDFFNITNYQLENDYRLSLHKQFVSDIKKFNSEKPPFFILHNTLPHVSYMYTPLGKRYADFDDAWILPGIDYSIDLWSNREQEVIQAQQRHMLQTMYVDKMFGEIVDELKNKELYNEALIILTSDHGVSFWPNCRRRLEQGENISIESSSISTEVHPELNFPLSDVYGIPLIIKYPKQNKKIILNTYAESVDVAPTVYDILNYNISQDLNGKSLVNNKSADNIRFDYINNATLKRSVNLFGDHSLQGIYRFGKNADLIGNNITNFNVIDTMNLKANINEMSNYLNVNLETNFIPSLIKGSLESTKKNKEITLIITVNDIIAGIEILNTNNHSFSFLVEEEFFIEGENKLNYIKQAL